jgi:hypothetical protein
MSTQKEIVIRSSGINEILSAPSPWIFRWSLSIMLIVLLLGLSLISIIKYPDIVSGKIIIKKLDQTQSVSIKDQGLDVELILPSKSISKITVGQKVNIKLYEYPYNDFGIIPGIIKNISPPKSNGNYEIEVFLLHGLKTTYNKTIMSSEVMFGIGEVQTTDLSVLERLINNF